MRLAFFPTGEVFFWTVFLDPDIFAVDEDDFVVVLPPLLEGGAEECRIGALLGLAFADSGDFAVALVADVGLAFEAVPFKEDLALAGWALPLMAGFPFAEGACFGGALPAFKAFLAALGLPVGALPEGLLLEDVAVFFAMAVVFD